MENSKTYESIGRTLYPLFFNRNFGLTTKSEIENLLFNIYLKEKKVTVKIIPIDFFRGS